MPAGPGPGSGPCAARRGRCPATTPILAGRVYSVRRFRRSSWAVSASRPARAGQVSRAGGLERRSWSRTGPIARPPQAARPGWSRSRRISRPMSRRRASYQGRSGSPCAALAVRAACRRPVDGAARSPAAPTTTAGGRAPGGIVPARSARHAVPPPPVRERRPFRPRAARAAAALAPPPAAHPAARGPERDGSPATARAGTAQPPPRGDSTSSIRITTGSSGPAPGLKAGTRACASASCGAIRPSARSTRKSPRPRAAGSSP